MYGRIEASEYKQETGNISGYYDRLRVGPIPSGSALRWSTLVSYQLDRSYSYHIATGRRWVPIDEVNWRINRRYAANYRKARPHIFDGTQRSRRHADLVTIWRQFVVWANQNGGLHEVDQKFWNHIKAGH